MFAGRQGGQRHGVVQVGRRADADQLHLVQPDQLAVVVEGARDVELPRRRLGSRFLGTSDRHHLDLGHGQEAGDLDPRAEPGANHADA